MLIQFGLGGMAQGGVHDAGTPMASGEALSRRPGCMQGSSAGRESAAGGCKTAAMRDAVSAAVSPLQHHALDRLAVVFLSAAHHLITSALAWQHIRGLLRTEHT